LTAAEVAQSLGVKVYTIGIGLRGKAPYPVVDQFGQKHYQYMDVDIDEDTLSKIAEKTHGKYYRADSADIFRRIYGEIDRLEKSEAEVKKYQHFDELFPFFIIAGLGVFLLEMILSHTVWRKLP
jgi:Ca-activated chloride channel family protein